MCMPTGKSQALSLAVHIVLAVLLFIAARSTSPAIKPQPPIHATPLTFFRLPKATESRGGGSNQTSLPAKHGSPPPRAPRTFIPPRPSDHPLLAMPITISFDIPLENTSATIGDPLSQLPVGAFGVNGANGIGDHGCCEGMGDSQHGPPGVASIHRERGVTPPELIYKGSPSSPKRRARPNTRAWSCWPSRWIQAAMSATSAYNAAWALVSTKRRSMRYRAGVFARVCSMANL